MILEVCLSNFFSIKDEIALDLRAGSINNKEAKMLQQNIFLSGKEKILKTVAIYGANASGKSNIIKAIQFCCSMILFSHQHNEGAIFNFQPFKFDGYDKKESSFKIRFILDKIEYEYGFSLNRMEVFTEYLYYYPNGRCAEIFTRDERKGNDKKAIYTFQNVIKKPWDIALNTSKKTLYLSRASQMDRDIAKKIYNYFNGQFIIGRKRLDAHNAEYLFNKYKSELLLSLQIADSDIIDITLKKEKIATKNLNINVDTNKLSVSDSEEENLIFTTYHKHTPSIPFNLDTEESEGTRRLFYRILIVIDIVRNNKVLLIDEIELCLHVKIVEYILALFNASNSAQLIYTTHMTNLLDLRRMRKDQIWFVNKKEDASSDLYSLYDYKDFRENMDAEKAYLQGRFDAVPFIDDSTFNIHNIIQ